MAKDSEQLRLDRQYLMQLQASGDIHLRKSPKDASDSYVHRVAQSLREQQRAGLPLSVQSARGHVRKESGQAIPESRRKAAPEAYELARKINRTEGASITSRGEVVLTDVDTMQSTIDYIASSSPSTRIFIEFEDGTIAYKHGGIRASELDRILRDEFDGDWDAFLDYMYEVMSHDSPKKKGA